MTAYEQWRDEEIDILRLELNLLDELRKQPGLELHFRSMVAYLDGHRWGNSIYDLD